MNRLENSCLFPRGWRREVHNFAIARLSRVRGLPTQPSDHWFVAVLRQICALKGMGLWSQSAMAHLTRLHGSGRERVEETMRRTAACLLICGLATILAGNALAQEIDWKKVDAALGRTGAAMPGGVQRYALPRSDLRVTVDGVAIKPALALGGWVVFAPAQGGAMLMGDVVLTETEIEPVMTKLLEGGVEITALHNHLLRADPATYYMHVGGQGDPVKMAQTIRSALSASKTPFEAAQAAPAPSVDLPTAQLDEIMAAKGQANGGVYQFGIPRKDPITEGGMAVAGAMGSANAINFQPTGGGKAAITGDFVVAGEEVDPLIRTLRENGIEVTAIHSHMLAEQPRVFFVHFWANDDAIKLAKGLRAALEKTAIAKG